jgi:hypothetical protein
LTNSEEKLQLHNRKNPLCSNKGKWLAGILSQLGKQAQRLNRKTKELAATIGPLKLTDKRGRDQ